MTSFIHHDVTGLITFDILIFNMIFTILNLIFKALYGSLIVGARNTVHIPLSLKFKSQMRILKWQCVE